jgi:type IV secretory pathway VirB3-like protein
MWIFTIALIFIPVCCWTNRRFVVARQSCYTKELTILFKKTLLCRQYMFFSPCRYSYKEKFEDTKGVIRKRKSKDRQHMTKGTRAYNDLQSNCWHRPYTKIIHVHVVFGSIRYLSSIEYMKALILVFIVDWLLNIWRASMLCFCLCVLFWRLGWIISSHEPLHICSKDIISTRIAIAW